MITETIHAEVEKRKQLNRKKVRKVNKTKFSSDKLKISQVDLLLDCDDHSKQQASTDIEPNDTVNSMDHDCDFDENVVKPTIHDKTVDDNIDKINW